VIAVPRGAAPAAADRTSRSPGPLRARLISGFVVRSAPLWTTR